MQVVITGGAGFIGAYLTHRLVQLGRLRDAEGVEREIERVTVLDPSIATAEVRVGCGGIPVHLCPGSVSDRQEILSTFAHPVVSVFHLATLLPGRTERDLSAALEVNVGGTNNVLEALRTGASAGKFVSASTVALYTRSGDAPIRDGEHFSPTTIYGLTKSIGEQFAEAYRIGTGLDVSGVRFPTVVIRPRSVPSSAGSALSDLLREISLGRDAIVRVHPETAVLVSDYQTCVDGMIRVHDAPADKIASNRFVNFSGVTVTVEEMIEAAARAARSAGRKPGGSKLDHDPFLQTTMNKWPTKVEGIQADALEVPVTPDLDGICERFLEDYESFWKSSTAL
ncbi:MAG TPA: NAD-dependent epimerase/dehydratase family protein [Thermomicrobiales bacterium]|nr:NAD-dependent epimerase/dehydratase family protein [Thermomicrobiales bacterium]